MKQDNTLDKRVQEELHSIRRTRFLAISSASLSLVAIVATIIFTEIEKRKDEDKQLLERQVLEQRMEFVGGTLDTGFVTLENGLRYPISSFYPPIDTSESYQLSRLYDGDGFSGRVVEIQKIP